MFGRSRVSKAPARPASEPAPWEMGLDTAAAFLRIMAEFALDQEKTGRATFAALAERWAQHVLIGTPAPHEEAPSGATRETNDGVGALGRRDWAGVRAFVRDYCRGAAAHTNTLLGDLRHVVWVFIQNLGHTLTEEEETDARLRAQLGRLAALAQGPETGELRREVLSMVQTVTQLFEERRRRQRSQLQQLGDRVQSLGSELESARRESETDPLTGLYNRRAFDDYLGRTVELGHAFGQKACLMLVDIDHFKQINDGFGHPVGDEVIVKVSEAMTRVFLRRSDFVARYGGDELAAVLRETTVDNGLEMAERLLRMVRALDIQRGGKRVPVSISVGLAALGERQESAAWIETADRSLYRAKQDGRDRASALG